MGNAKLKRESLHLEILKRDFFYIKFVIYFYFYFKTDFEVVIRTTRKWAITRFNSSTACVRVRSIFNLLFPAKKITAFKL